MMIAFGLPERDIEAARPITTLEQMSEAMDTLFNWRFSNGLETVIMYFQAPEDAARTPTSYYEMCSEETKAVAKSLADHIMTTCCDDRPINYEPMLTRLSDWIE